MNSKPCEVCSGRGFVDETKTYMRPSGEAYVYTRELVRSVVVERSCLRCGGKVSQ